MYKIKMIDPYNLDSKEFNRNKIQRIDPSIEDKDAIYLWNTVMRSTYDKNGNEVLNAPDTASQVLARKIEEFINDKEHVWEEFCEDRITYKQIWKSAKFSKSKWNRILSGELLDLEKGNVFAIAIALRLDEYETAELMYAAGFAINHEHDLDAAMMYFIHNKIYDMDKIYSILSNFSDIKNGLDCFAFTPKK